MELSVARTVNTARLDMVVAALGIISTHENKAYNVAKEKSLFCTHA